MGIFKSQEFLDVICNARKEEAELVKKKMNIKFSIDTKRIQNECNLKVAELEARAKRLEDTIDEFEKYIKDADDKLLKANEESLKTKIQTVKLKNAAEIVMTNHASALRPFLKSSDDLDNLNKKTLEIESPKENE